MLKPSETQENCGVSATADASALILGSGASRSLEDIGRKDIRPDGYPCTQWFFETATALSDLHQKGILHCGIKPSSLLITRQNECASVKLIDFGLADHAASKDAKETLIAPPHFAAPEQLRGLAEPASDVFSLGATFLWLITGNHLSQGDVNQVISDRLAATSYRHLLASLPTAWQSLLGKLLEVDPARRPRDGSEVLAAFRSAFPHHPGLPVPWISAGNSAEFNSPTPSPIPNPDLSFPPLPPRPAPHTPATPPAGTEVPWVPPKPPKPQPPPAQTEVPWPPPKPPTPQTPPAEMESSWVPPKPKPPPTSAEAPWIPPKPPTPPSPQPLPAETDAPWVPPTPPKPQFTSDESEAPWVPSAPPTPPSPQPLPAETEAPWVPPTPPTPQLASIESEVPYRPPISHNPEPLPAKRKPTTTILAATSALIMLASASAAWFFIIKPKSASSAKPPLPPVAAHPAPTKTQPPSTPPSTTVPPAPPGGTPPQTAPLIKVPDDAPTIAEALQRCEEGGTVEIAGGIYTEPIVITRSVSLVSKTAAVIEDKGIHSCMITARGPIDVTLRNIQIRNTLEQTDLPADSSPSLVLITGKARVSMEVCVIASSIGDGISIADGASLTLTNCRIRKNRRMGISLSSGATLNLSLSEVHDNGGSGIAAMNAGSTVTLGNGAKISSNSQHGIEIGNGAQLQASGSSIRQNHKVGVLVESAGSHASLNQSSVISENRKFGIGVRDSASLILNEAVIEENSENGIYVESGGSAEVTASRFKSNGTIGIYLVGGTSSSVTVSRSSFESHSDAGVAVVEGTGKLADNRFNNNTMAIFYGKDSRGSATGNVISPGPIDQTLILEQAGDVTLQNNTLDATR